MSVVRSPASAEFSVSPLEVSWPVLASFPFPFPSQILCLSDLHLSSHDPCPPQFLEMPHFIKTIKAVKETCCPAPPPVTTPTPVIVTSVQTQRERTVPLVSDRPPFQLCAGPPTLDPPSIIPSFLDLQNTLLLRLPFSTKPPNVLRAFASYKALCNPHSSQ